MVLAVLTKESAYAFPLLLAPTLAVLPGCSRRDVKRSLPFWALAATRFAIRWWVLGGIGGYLDQRSGKAEVFQLCVLAAAKAAALRIWSTLYFLINWSVRPCRGFALLAALSVALIVWILWTTPLDRRRACSALVFVMIGALPALPQMLIGADLQSHACSRSDWVVYSKPPFGGAEHALRYLGGYTHRVAISNHRLVALEEGSGHLPLARLAPQQETVDAPSR